MCEIKGLLCIFVHGDSKLVINVVQELCGVPWRLRQIIEDIRWLTSSFLLVKWARIFRKVNFVADAIVSADLSFQNMHIWDTCILDVAYNAFLFDGIGIWLYDMLLSLNELFIYIIKFFRLF